MKKSLIRVLTTVLVVIMMLPYMSFADEVIFNDIEDSYVKKEIEALFKANILEGFGDGKFNPRGHMNRAQLSTVLVRVLNLEQDKEGAKNFTDVSQDSWYAGYVGAIAKTGITIGLSPDIFDPNSNVTKQELAIFYIRALGLEERAKEESINLEFADADKVSDWASDYVGLATYLGLMPTIANDDGTFRFEPRIDVDRELLADITYRLHNDKELYYDILGIEGVVEKPVEPAEPTKPEETVKPGEPVKPTEPVKPGDPTKPTEPVKPTEPTEPTEPTKPVEPPTDNDGFKIENAVGKQVEFMGAYLISVEFNVIGNVDVENVRLVINDGLENEMQIKKGTPKNYDFYFDGMVVNVNNITLYIGTEKVDLTNIINWE